ncbi:NADPH-dependent FMN reductase [Lutimonas sp.]|uniref:NADPH-dependent FMN reductase n=1 Tax=Lutimonas sp. TaxID=1872403 RepID=UPI003D9B6B24
MKKVITLGGSSSKGSINKVLAEYAGSLVNDASIINLDLNDYNLPLYSIDIENESGFPDDLNALNKILEESDGIVLSLAEHNGAYSAAFKNTFDWLSRIEGKVWRNKPMLLLSTSPGPRGGQSVMELALSRFPYNGGNIVASMTFPSFGQNFIDGDVVDDALKLQINEAATALSKAI